jgi:hypothetical protein
MSLKRRKAVDPIPARYTLFLNFFSKALLFCLDNKDITREIMPSFLLVSFEDFLIKAG